jgi:hypothetical protein
VPAEFVIVVLGLKRRPDVPKEKLAIGSLPDVELVMED